MGKQVESRRVAPFLEKISRFLLFLPYLIIRDCLYVNSPDRDQIDRNFVLCTNPSLGNRHIFQKCAYLMHTTQNLRDPVTFMTS